VNLYFPKSTHGDRLNDFGVVSPKAIARSFAKFGHRHPELAYRVLRIAQMPGDLPLSNEVRSGTELTFHSKRWLIPMLLKPHELALFTTTYFLTGRFNPQKEFERHSGVEVGSAESWDSYRAAFQRLMHSDSGNASALSMQNMAREVDRLGAVTVDDNGLAWAEIPDQAGIRRLGLGQANVLSADSDRQLAYRLLLAKTGTELKSPSSRRESLQEFTRDWKLLEASRLVTVGGEASVSSISGESGNNQ
jgi:hypothetical protein